MNKLPKYTIIGLIFAILIALIGSIFTDWTSILILVISTGVLSGLVLFIMRTVRFNRKTVLIITLIVITLIGYASFVGYLGPFILWSKVVKLANDCKVATLTDGHRSDSVELIDGGGFIIVDSSGYYSMNRLAREVGLKCGRNISIGIE